MINNAAFIINVLIVLKIKRLVGYTFIANYMCGEKRFRKDGSQKAFDSVNLSGLFLAD